MEKRSAAVTAIVVMTADVSVNDKGEFEELDIDDIDIVNEIDSIISVDIIEQKRR